MSEKLGGLRAVVTGGTRGIGLACAETFVQEGASVVICGRDAATVRSVIESGHDGRMNGIVCDVTDTDSVEGFIADAADWLGGIDVLVNNAGAYRAGRFEDLSDDDWSTLFDVNVFGTVRCTRAALEHMGGTGRIINIASTAGKYGSLYQSVYNASKHAVVGLTRCLALEYAASDIRVNAICPGFVETDMVASQSHTIARLIDVPQEDVMDALRARVPIGRFVTTEEVAALAVYLASDDAASMTGQALTISGGLILV